MSVRRSCSKGHLRYIRELPAESLVSHGVFKVYDVDGFLHSTHRATELSTGGDPVAAGVTNAGREVKVVATTFEWRGTEILRDVMEQPVYWREGERHTFVAPLDSLD